MSKETFTRIKKKKKVVAEQPGAENKNQGKVGKRIEKCF